MKKRVLSLLMAMIMVVGVLTACGKTENANNNTPTQKENDNNDSDNTGSDNEAEATAQFLNLYKINTNEYDTQNYDGGYVTVARMHTERVVLTNEDAAKYPELATALEEFGDRIEGLAKDEFDLCKEAGAVDIDSIPSDGYFTERHVNVRRADEYVVSLSSSYSYYAGGAHPYGGDWPASFDAKTGKELKLTDVVKDIDAMYEYVTEAIKVKYADYLDEFFNINDDDPFAGFKSGEYTQAFAVDYDGLSIIFNPYDIASYATGQQVIKIPFKGHEDLLEAKYFESVPESYIVEVDDYSEYDIDIDNDGEFDSLLFSPYYNEYECLESLNVIINNEGYEYKNGEGDKYIDAFSGRNFIYKTKDGKVFYYYLGCGCNDYRTFNSFEIKKDGIGEWNSFYASIAYPIEANDRAIDFSWADGCLTNPDNCLLQNRSDMFGTVSVVRLCKFDVNGQITPLDELYTFYDTTPHKVLTSIKVEIVDENGNKTGERDLTVGEEVRPYKTDNESVVYVLDKDGNILKFNETNEWPRQVDGIDIESVFENILYAG